MKKRILVVSIVFLTIFISIIVMSYNTNTKKKFTQDGVTYALTLDGASINTFPSKGMYRVDVECGNATGKWLYDEWKLAVEDINGTNATCDVSFTTISTTYLNNYITGLSGSTQGTGQVVDEQVTLDNSTFSPTTTLAQNNYSNLSNDTSYPFTWDSTNKTWTSTNKTDSTTSTITFNPSSNGYYQLCYTVSSKANYDKATFYVDNSQKAQDSGSKSSCVYFGNLTTSNTIKVTYSKDSSSSSGNDNVVFYLQSGTYNEKIETISAGIRYEGKNPNNYIWFNNELWRIIGVFDSASHGVSGQNLVKIIRNNSIGALGWDKNNINNWNQSSLKSILNGAYYNAENGTGGEYCYGYSTTTPGNCDYTESGINDTYRPMIENVTWYLGGHSSTSATAEAFYGYERGTTVYSGRPTTATGYIGLMYPSDYGYSVLSSSCARTTNLSSYNNATCAGQSWLYGQGYGWTITPRSSRSDHVFYLIHSGYYGSANYGFSARPVLYLDSSVYVYDGNGSQSDPYIIGM